MAMDRRAKAALVVLGLLRVSWPSGVYTIAESAFAVMLWLSLISVVMQCGARLAVVDVETEAVTLKHKPPANSLCSSVA